jgi:hypothetical protein
MPQVAPADGRASYDFPTNDDGPMRHCCRVDATQIQTAFDDVFDQAIVFHGFADYVRDYDVIVYATADPGTGIAPEHSRYRFKNCVRATATSAVTAQIWRKSLDERLVDYDQGVETGSREPATGGSERNHPGRWGEANHRASTGKSRHFQKRGPPSVASYRRTAECLGFFMRGALARFRHSFSVSASRHTSTELMRSGSTESAVMAT